MGVPPGKEDMGRRGVRTHRYTLMINKENNLTEIDLYDNRTDPFQLNNLSDTRNDLVEELSVELKYWLEETNDPWIRHLE